MTAAETIARCAAPPCILRHADGYPCLISVTGWLVQSHWLLSVIHYQGQCLEKQHIQKHLLKSESGELLAVLLLRQCQGELPVIVSL